MLSSNDLRFLLVASSIGNNSWFLVSQQASVWVFLFFMLTYSLFLGFLLSTFNQMSKLSYVSALYFRPWLFFLSLSGLPPFPIFFMKISVILSLFTTGFMPYFAFIFLFFAVFIVAGYVNYMIKNLTYRYSSSSLFLSL